MPGGLSGVTTIDYRKKRFTSVHQGERVFGIIGSTKSAPSFVKIEQLLFVHYVTAFRCNRQSLNLKLLNAKYR